MSGLRVCRDGGLLIGSYRLCLLAIIPIALLLAVLASCSKPAEPERKVKMYQSPMHPWITSDKPGNCTDLWDGACPRL